MKFGRQVADVSNGRLLDGDATHLVAFRVPSPASPNSLPCAARGYWPVAPATQHILLEWVGTPRINTTTNSIRVFNGPSRSAVVLFVALGPGVFPLGGGVHFMLGGRVVIPRALTTNVRGAAELAIPLPADPGLKGLAVYLQVGAAVGAGWTASNGVEVRVCR